MAIYEPVRVLTVMASYSFATALAEMELAPHQLR